MMLGNSLIPTDETVIEAETEEEKAFIDKYF